METAPAQNPNQPENQEQPIVDPDMRQAVADKVRENAIEAAAILRGEADPQLHNLHVERLAYEQATEREAQARALGLIKKTKEEQLATRMTYPWGEAYFEAAMEREQILKQLQGEPHQPEEPINTGEMSNDDRIEHETRAARKLTLALGKEIARKLTEANIQPDTQTYTIGTIPGFKGPGKSLMDHGTWFKKTEEEIHKKSVSGWLLPQPGKHGKYVEGQFGTPRVTMLCTDGTILTGIGKVESANPDGTGPHKIAFRPNAGEKRDGKGELISASKHYTSVVTEGEFASDLGLTNLPQPNPAQPDTFNPLSAARHVFNREHTLQEGLINLLAESTGEVQVPKSSKSSASEQETQRIIVEGNEPPEEEGSEPETAEEILKTSDDEEDGDQDKSNDDNAESRSSNWERVNEAAKQEGNETLVGLMCQNSDTGEKFEIIGIEGEGPTAKYKFVAEGKDQDPSVIQVIDAGKLEKLIDSGNYELLSIRKK